MNRDETGSPWLFAVDSARSPMANTCYRQLVSSLIKLSVPKERPSKRILLEINGNTAEKVNLELAMGLFDAALSCRPELAAYVGCPLQIQRSSWIQSDSDFRKSVPISAKANTGCPRI